MRVRVRPEWGVLAHDGKGFWLYRKDSPLPRVLRSVAMYRSKVGRGSCLLVDNVAAIDEGRRALSTQNSIVPSKVKCQLRVETNTARAFDEQKEQIPTYDTPEGRSNKRQPMTQYHQSLVQDSAWCIKC